MNVMGYSDVYKDPFIRHFTVSYFPINTILEIFCTFKLIDHVNLSIRENEGLRKGNQICLNFNKNMDKVNSTWLTLEFKVFLLRHFLRIDPFRQNNKCFAEFIHRACISLMNVLEFYCALLTFSCINSMACNFLNWCSATKFTQINFSKQKLCSKVTKCDGENCLLL